MQDLYEFHSTRFLLNDTYYQYYCIPLEVVYFFVHFHEHKYYPW